MDYERLKRSYSHLTDDELRREIKDRSARRYDTRMVGADGCMTDALVLQVCRELLDNHDTLNRGWQHGKHGQ